MRLNDEFPDEVDDALARLRRGDGEGVDDLLDADEPNVEPLRIGSLFAARLEAEATPLRAGTCVGRYTLQGMLGRGGLSIVYEATQAVTGRTVALKLIRSGRLSGPVEAQVLQHEAAMLARLRHPNIVQVIDAGTTEGRSYVAMEKADGVSLSEWLRGQGRSIDERVSLFLGLCRAIQHAHEQGVIHRDLKPTNVKIDEFGSARILDFGLARLFANDAIRDTTGFVLRNEPIGTLTWMSPEQTRGDDAGTPSDIYALGLLLYFLLEESLPYDFPQSDRGEIARVVCSSPPRPLSLSNAAPIEAIAFKALRKLPAQRYASAKELADDIERFQRNEPILAQPSNRWSELCYFARRHRLMVSATATVLLVTSVALAVTLTTLNRTRAMGSRLQSTTSFLEGLFLAADPERGDLQEMRVGELVDLADELIPEETEPSLRAEFLLLAANFNQRFGGIEKARSLADQALQLLESVHGEQDHPRLADGLRAAGFARHAVDPNDPLALALKQRALAMRMRLFGDTYHPDVVQSRDEMGDILLDTGKPDQALYYFRRNVEELRHRESPRDSLLAEMLFKLSNCLDYVGDHNSALGRRQEAYAVVTSMPLDKEDVPRAVRVTVSLIQSLLFHRRSDEAEQIGQTWLRRAHESGWRAVELGRLERTLSNIESRRGDHVRALELAQQARASLSLNLSGRHLEIISLRMQIASELCATGDIARAEVEIRSILDDLEQLPAHRLEGINAWCALSSCYFAQGRLDEGDDALQRALLMAQERGSREWEARVLTLQAKQLTDRGEYDAALDVAQSATKVAAETLPTGEMTLHRSFLAKIEAERSLRRWDDALATLAETERQLAPSATNHPRQAVVIHQIRGELLIKLLRWDDARDEFNRAIAAIPDDRDEWVELRATIKEQLDLITANSSR